MKREEERGVGGKERELEVAAVKRQSQVDVSYG